MRRFELVRSYTDHLTSQSGLALVGRALGHTYLDRDLATIPLRHGIAHSDCVKSYVGLLCTAKSDFEAVEIRRKDAFFKTALGVKKVPSASRLRQRFDERANAMLPIIDAASIDFIANIGAPVTPTALAYGTSLRAVKHKYVVLDIDVFPMDNSGTKKEGVSYTYKGFNGYAPLAAYLGEEGWCLACECALAARMARKNSSISWNGSCRAPGGSRGTVCLPVSTADMMPPTIVPGLQSRMLISSSSGTHADRALKPG